MDDNIWQRAAYWVDHLNDLHAANDLAEFEAWLDADPDHVNAFLSLKSHCDSDELKACLQRAKQIHDNQKVSHNTLGKLEKPGFKTRFAKPALATAAVLVLALTLFFPDSTKQTPNEQNLEPQVVETKVAKRSKMEMVDGSIAHLNASTQLKIALDSSERRTSVEKGEVFFQVARDEQRPFFVTAGDVEVRVLGTAFNVDKREDYVSIKVREGKVRVSADRQVELTGGQMVVVSASKIGPIQHINANEVAQGWRNGWIEAQSTPLTDILDQLQRYTAKKILIDNDILGNNSISGRFHLDKPQETIELIATLYQFDIEVGENSIRLSTP